MVVANKQNAGADSRRNFGLRDKLAPPPKTATLRRLEKMLDEKPNKRKKPIHHVSQTATDPVVTSTVPMIMPPQGRNTPIDDALAFRGGLASVPTFRKAILPPRKKPCLEPKISIPIRQRQEILDTSSMFSSHVTGNSSSTKPLTSVQDSLDQQRQEPHLPLSPRTLTKNSPQQSAKNENSWKRKSSNTDCENKHSQFDHKVLEDAATKSNNKEINMANNEEDTTPPPSRQIGLKLRKVQKDFIRKTVGNLNIQVSHLDENTCQPDIVDENHLLTIPTASSSQLSEKDKVPLPAVGAKDDHHPSLSSIMISKDSSNVLGTYMDPSSSTNLHRQRKSSATANDNFVRLNLRNSAGACRGARNKKTRRKTRYRKDACEANQEMNSDDEDPETTIKSKSALGGQMYVSRMSGRDPMDDFLDGVFGNATTARPKVKTPKSTSSNNDDTDVPCCARHQRPCKLLVVKKNTTGNKGRKFFACSMSRGENCDYFQWAEDTIEAARKTVANNAHHSSFVARQVAAHVDRFRNLTVPELQNEAIRRGLNKSGKKSQLLLRLALWARDEIVNAIPYPEEEKDNSANTELTLTSKNFTIDQDVLLSESDDDSSSESSVEELELIDHHEEDSGCQVDSKSNQEKRKEDLLLEKLSPKAKLLSHLSIIFGYSEFREGQEWAIERCISGQRSLLVAPTGFGKSLCYALPAALMDGACVVVSPLISLIQDQLRSLPPRIPAATLSGSLSASDTAAILDDVARKRIKILFVSPERLTSPSFRRLFCPKWNTDTQQQERTFPEISILCVDEAHCVSQWAHNFRPCFLRFKGLLQLMKPRSILAVTATAGDRVIQDICNTLGIPSKFERPDSSIDSEESILIVDKPRDNIDVNCQFVKSDDERLNLLTKILKPQPSENSSEMRTFAGTLAKGSVIVYVWRQRDTEIAAETIQSAGVKGGVVIYHGGMDATARSKAQSKFMRGKARICVATVAFGMGIDKADVEGIIHMNLPSSPEHYLQEIGRAGRDGRQARAIAIPSIDEIPIRHSLVHSNFLSKSQIRALIFSLKRAVLHCKVESNPISSNVALPIDDIVLECDCKVETIETLLSILEQNGGDNPLFHVEGFNYDKVTIALKKRTLDKLAENLPVASSIQRVGACLDMAMEQQDNSEAYSHQKSSFERQFLAYGQGSYSFSVAKCANALGPSAECRHVFAALRRLQESGEIELALDTSSKGRVLLLKLSEEGSSFFNSVDLEIRADDIVDRLHDSFSSSIFSAANKVLDMSCILDSMATADTSVANETLGPHGTGKPPTQLKFQELVRDYFSKGLDNLTETESRRILAKSFFSVNRRELESDLFALLQDIPILTKKASDSDFAPIFGKSKFGDYTVVAAAKFLHGLDSARAPIATFRGHFLFGKWKQTHFRYLLQEVEKLVLVTPSKGGDK